VHLGFNFGEIVLGERLVAHKFVEEAVLDGGPMPSFTLG